MESDLSLAMSFITNSPHVVDLRSASPARLNVLADLISSRGAEIERLTLPEFQEDPASCRLAEAVRDSATISCFCIGCFCPIDNPIAVQALSTVLRNEKSLREVVVGRIYASSPELDQLADSPLPTMQEAFNSHQHWADSQVSPQMISDLHKMRMIESVELMHVIPEDSGVSALAAALHDWPRLESLALINTKIEAKGAAALAAAFSRGCAARLRVLDLSFDMLKDAEIATIIDGILVCYRPKRRSELRSLRLQYNHIGAAGSEKLAALIRCCPRLENIQLDNNRIGDSPALGEALGTCARSLRKLWVGNCRLGPRATAAICCSLASGAGLVRLGMGNNTFDISGTKALATALARVGPRLKKLIISKTDMLAAHGNELAAGLAQAKLLRLLDLRYNEGIGTATLLDALPDSLQVLELCKCGVDDSGGEALGRFILRAEYLRNLDLSQNAFRYRGIKAISEAVAQSRSILNLTLNWNKLENSGTELVAENIVKRNRSIRWLNIKQIGMGEEGCEAIAKAVVDATARGDVALEEICISEEEDRGQTIKNAAILSSSPIKIWFW